MTPRRRQRRQAHSLLCLAYLSSISFASPVIPVYNNVTPSTLQESTYPAHPHIPTLPLPPLSSPPLTPNVLNATASSPEGRVSTAMVSWLWGLVWGDESTVSVVDRTPEMRFSGRPAAFGLMKDVLGYMIRVEDFSEPCNDTSGGGGGDEDEDEGGGIDEPWWPGGGSEQGWRERMEWERMRAQDARYGCPKLCVGGEHKPEVSETWIALIMRGGCSFVEKVREAQRFGAKGVVVGGETTEQDGHGDGLVQMYSLGDASDITIPSVYIAHASYNTLSTLIASSNTSTWGLRTVSVGITTDPSGWDWYSPILTFLVLLFLPSTLTLLTLLIHRIRAARAARRERAPENVVHNLPWRIWEGQQTVMELEKLLDNVKVEEVEQGGQVIGEEGASEPSTSGTRETEQVQTPAVATQMHWYDTQGECAICLEDFAKGDKVRVLPCRHIFHMEEVDDWLIRRKKLCPICKHDVTLPLGAEPQPEGNAVEEASSENNSPSERTPLLQSQSPSS